MDKLQIDSILVVDDDPTLRELLVDYLSGNGFDVTAVADGIAMRSVLDTHPFELIVLDLMLPGEDGLSLTRFLRSKTHIPILMLSAQGEDVDRIIGLEVGVDDYLGKPFNPRELLARIRALLRRQDHHRESQSPQDRQHEKFGPFTVDLVGRRLIRGDDEIHLTTGEFDLLSLFVKQPNRVLTRDMLIESLKGYDRDAFDRSIDIRITRLRHKIEANPAAPIFIRTIRGEGYLFNPARQVHKKTP